MSYYFNLAIFILISSIYLLIEPKIKKQQNKYVYLGLVIGYSIFIALRPPFVKDTVSYINIYNSIDEHQFYVPNFFTKKFSVEYGFIYLVQVFKILFENNYRVLFFCIPVFNILLTVYSMKLIIKECIKDNGVINNLRYQYAGIFVIYNSYFGFLYNGIVLRAGISYSFACYAVAKFMQKKYLPCCISLFLAFSFQRVSIITIMVIVAIRYFPIFQKKVNIIIWVVMGLLLISGFGNLFIETLVIQAGKILSNFGISGFSGYLINLDQEIGKIDIYIWLLGGLLLLWKIRYKKYYQLVNIYFLGIVVIIFFSSVRASSRIYDYFILYMVPLFFIIYNYGSFKYKIGKIKLKSVFILLVIVTNSFLMYRLIM